MSILKKAAIILAAALALAGAAACSHKRSNDKPVYSVSYPIQKTLLHAIVGDKAEINTLIPAGTNPETYDPSMSTLVSLENSDAYFRLNTPGFEEAIMAKSGNGIQTVDCSRGIKTINGTHGAEHADPHVWTSVKNAQIIADNIFRSLKPESAEDAETYKRNYQKLKGLLKATDDSIAYILAESKGKAFVVMHPSLSYFARDYGLRQVAMETDGKEASPRQLAERMEKARKLKAKVLIHDREHSPAQAKNVAEQLGLKLIIVSLNGNDWREEMMKTAHAIADN